MTVSPQILDAISQSQAATMTAGVVSESGSGKAYQWAAQSAAIAVQDATDTLRAMTTIATTATGVAISQFLASGDARYLEALAPLRAMVNDAVGDYARIGATAAQILSEFPSD